MVAAQHAHLGAAAGAGGLDGLARAVEDAHVRHRAGSTRLGALDAGALRSDRREIVADAATAPHRFGRLGQRRVDAGTAIGVFDDGVANRLHEAVDQRCLEVGAGSGIDPASRNETVFLGPQELRFPVGLICFRLNLGQRVGDATADVMDVGFFALGILFDEHFGGNFLFRQRCELRCFGNVSQRKLFGDFAHPRLLYKIRILWVVNFRMLQSY